MWRLLLILLFFPASIQASCTEASDPAFNLAVSQGDCAKAFGIVSDELLLSSAEISHFKIIPGFSGAHDDRNGQADPDSLELRLDPGLFLEGKEGACQGVAHEVTHLRQFLRDRRLLDAHYPKDPQREQDAYDSLEDNDLAAHAAAQDIEAVLAQIPYASGGALRDEDFRYLVENLKRWADSQTMMISRSNESYYLPDIKREDARMASRGERYVRHER
jgi:hypothetical protein